MGAKLKSKTHLPNKSFDFLSLFLRILRQSFQKCYYDQNLSAKQVWRTWAKVKILHISVTFLLITCFVHFCYFFSGLEISVKFFVFWYPSWIFEEIFFFALISTFVNFDCKCARNGSKAENIFYECVFEFKGTQAWNFFFTFFAETETIWPQGPVTRDF